MQRRCFYFRLAFVGISLPALRLYPWLNGELAQSQTVATMAATFSQLSAYSQRTDETTRDFVVTRWDGASGCHNVRVHVHIHIANV